MGALGLRYAILILLIVAGASLGLRLLGGSANRGPSAITSFEECATAGYPIQESYPRQCRTPEGKTFVSLTDVFDSTIDVSCRQDSDCVLANKEQGFGCCYVGACESVDYSQEQWVAVNQSWFSENQDRYCPAKKEECGPAPGCATRIVNDDFEVKCLTNICQKVAQ